MKDNTNFEERYRTIVSILFESPSYNSWNDHLDLSNYSTIEALIRVWEKEKYEKIKDKLKEEYKKNNEE